MSDATVCPDCGERMRVGPRRTLYCHACLGDGVSPSTESASEETTAARTVAACPECDSPDIGHRRGGHVSTHRPHDDPDWVCWACRHEFDDATEREAHDARGGRHGLARTLDAADTERVGR